MTHQEIIDHQKVTIMMLKARIADFEMQIEKYPWQHHHPDWRPTEIADCRNKLEEARRIIGALERQIPKTVLYDKVLENDVCPMCESELQIISNYCHYCGQRLDWSEIDVD